MEWLTPQLILSLATLIGAIVAAFQSLKNGQVAKANTIAVADVASTVRANADDTTKTTAITNDKLEVIHKATNSATDKLNARLDESMAEARAAREENKALRLEFSEFLKTTAVRRSDDPKAQ